ncbi:MAG: glutaredoxin [Hyphomonas sp.]
MFALEWCEFCWSARKVLDAMGVRYRSVDLDSVAYQAGDFGGRIRKVLTAKTGIATIPQIFVGGDLIGGATDLIGAAQSRSLHDRLKKAGMEYIDLAAPPHNFLPKWLKQSRAS